MTVTEGGALPERPEAEEGVDHGLAPRVLPRAYAPEDASLAPRAAELRARRRAALRGRSGEVWAAHQARLHARHRQRDLLVADAPLRPPLRQRLDESLRVAPHTHQAVDPLLRRRLAEHRGVVLPV
jgi:hypothetical protein